MSQTEVELIKSNAIKTADIADEQITLAKLEHGTSSNDGKFLRANNGADPTFETVSTTNPTIAHAFAFMDSQYFTSSVTLLEFNPSTTNDQSSGVTIDRTNDRFTPTVAGVYQVQAVLHFSHAGNVYTPVVYIYKNGSSFVNAANIVNYNGGHHDSIFVQAMISMNGSSDYVDMRGSHNGGGNATMFTTSTFTMFRVGA